MVLKDEINEELAAQLDHETKNWSVIDTLKYLAERFEGTTTFSTSFGQEDQVITDMIFTARIPVLVFTLDTGRHFEETYKVMSQTLARYEKKIKVLFPDQQKVEQLLTNKGPFSFYESIENRKECCYIRKVEPLERMLKETACWITGLRAAQSNSRQTIRRISYDPTYQVIKVNPLYNWSLEEVVTYLHDNHVPYNILHDKGYPSIGCAPCTRAVPPGEDIRAGRWWWETNSSKECGLHDNQENTQL
ncbi:MAG: phosphoadenylyl-sulfate reductase [Bacteroidales bacterium]